MAKYRRKGKLKRTIGFTHPLHMVVVWFLGLDPLEDGLVLMGDTQQVTLTSCLVQTTGEIYAHRELVVPIYTSSGGSYLCCPRGL